MTGESAVRLRETAPGPLEAYLDVPAEGDLHVDSGDVPELVAALDDDDGETRQEAASALREVGEQSPGLLSNSASPVRALLEGLTDEEVAVRREATRALGELSEAFPELIGETDVSEAVAKLVTDLNDSGDAAIREQAAVALGILARVAPDSLEDTAAIETLVDALTDDAPAVRQASVSALRRVGTRVLAISGEGDCAPVSGLVRTLEDPEPSIRAEAITALTDLGRENPALLTETDAAAGLVDALDDESTVRTRAVNAIRALATTEPALFADTDVVEALLDEVTDANSAIQPLASETLTAIASDAPELLATSEGVSKLVRIAGDDAVAPSVRKQAVETLQPVARSDPTLLEDTDALEQLQTTDAPEEVEAAIDALLAALDGDATEQATDTGDASPAQTDETDSTEAPDQDVLAELTAVDIDDDEVRAVTVNTIEKVYTHPDPDVALPNLLGLLDESDASVRTVGVLALGQFGYVTPDFLSETPAMDRLVDALADESVAVRRRAASQLGRIGSENPALLANTDAVERLRTLADEADDEQTRTAAGDALEIIQQA